MVPDLQPGDLHYSVQPGDKLSVIAEWFYRDPAAFNLTVEANLGREQTTGQIPQDARCIYPGWQLLVPQPTQRNSHANPATR